MFTRKNKNVPRRTHAHTQTLALTTGQRRAYHGVMEDVQSAVDAQSRDDDDDDDLVCGCCFASCFGCGCSSEDEAFLGSGGDEPLYKTGNVEMQRLGTRPTSGDPTLESLQSIKSIGASASNSARTLNDEVTDAWRRDFKPMDAYVLSLKNGKSEEMAEAARFVRDPPEKVLVAARTVLTSDEDVSRPLIVEALANFERVLRFTPGLSDKRRLLRELEEYKERYDHYKQGDITLASVSLEAARNALRDTMYRISDYQRAMYYTNDQEEKILIMQEYTAFCYRL
jgi:hypothetical protein